MAQHPALPQNPTPSAERQLTSRDINNRKPAQAKTTDKIALNHRWVFRYAQRATAVENAMAYPKKTHAPSAAQDATTANACPWR